MVYDLTDHKARLTRAWGGARAKQIFDNGDELVGKVIEDDSLGAIVNGQGNLSLVDLSNGLLELYPGYLLHEGSYAILDLVDIGVLKREEFRDNSSRYSLA